VNKSFVLFIFLFLPLVAKGDFAVFFALEIDANEIKNAGSTLGAPLAIAGSTIHRLRLGDHTIYLCQMGSGCLETSLHAQNLFQRFSCSAAYSLGPAATLDASLDIGSWHAVSEVLGWQVGMWAPTGFQLNPKAMIQLSVASHPLTMGSARVLASGDSFIADSSQRQFIRNATQASLLDMNLYGLARSCQEWKVPLHAWKVISDRADPNASADFKKFCSSYDGRGGRELAAYLKGLPIPKTEPEAHPQIQRHLRPKAEIGKPSASGGDTNLH
jgi:adenosylhomocysteine/aminodeoxyfutalosine nucleosidase